MSVVKHAYNVEFIAEPTGVEECSLVVVVLTRRVSVVANAVEKALEGKRPLPYRRRSVCCGS